MTYINDEKNVRALLQVLLKEVQVGENFGFPLLQLVKTFQCISVIFNMRLTNIELH